MYNDVRHLFNILHELVFKNYEIEYFNVNLDYILIKSKVTGFFVRIDFDQDRSNQYKNTIQFIDLDYSRTDEVLLDNFNKNAYFDAVMLNTTLKYDDVMHISHQTSMFAKAIGRSVCVCVSRVKQRK